MLDRCQAYLIAKTPHQIAGLHNLVRGAGFQHSFDVATGDGNLDPGAPIKFFFVHYEVPDGEMAAAMAAVRGRSDDALRFAPFVLIINDCSYEDIIKYVHLGFDDVISLPEKAKIVQHRLETLLTVEHSYFETPTYFGPDRRRLEIVPVEDNRRHPLGGRHIRYQILRDPVRGVRIVKQVMMAA